MPKIDPHSGSFAGAEGSSLFIGGWLSIQFNGYRWVLLLYRPVGAGAGAEIFVFASASLFATRRAREQAHKQGLN